MAQPLTVAPATLKDASYIMANLQPDDACEVDCQVDQTRPRHEMGVGLLMAGDNFAVRRGDQPIMFFGTMPMNVCYLTVWALGTRQSWRAANAVVDYMLDVHLPERLKQGFIGMEARAWIGHRTARSWIEATGGKPDGEPFEFGRDRELFLTFRWTDHEIESIRQTRRRAA